MSSIADLSMEEIEQFAAYRAARQENDTSEFLSGAIAQTICLYRHLGAAVTFAGYVGAKHKLLWVYVSDNGPTRVCHTLHDLSMAIAADAKDSGLSGDLAYDWYMSPNINASNADDWAMAGRTVHNLDTFIRYLQQRGEATQDAAA